MPHSNKAMWRFSLLEQVKINKLRYINANFKEKNNETKNIFKSI